MVDVVVLAVSSSRSDPILRRKWRRLRELHTYGAATSPPSLVQQVWWRDRLDLQHDGVVLMVESFCGRASPTRSRERERWRAAVGRWLGLELEGAAPLPPLIWGAGRLPWPLLQALGRRLGGKSGGQVSPLLLEGSLRVSPKGWPAGP